MSTNHWIPNKPLHRERLIDLAKFRRSAAAPAISQPPPEVQVLESIEDIPGDEIVGDFAAE